MVLNNRPQTSALGRQPKPQHPEAGIVFGVPGLVHGMDRTGQE